MPGLFASPTKPSPLHKIPDRTVEPLHGWLHAIPDRTVEPPHGWLHKIPDRTVEPPHGWLHAIPDRIVEPPHGWLHAIPDRSVEPPHGWLHVILIAGAAMGWLYPVVTSPVYIAVQVAQEFRSCIEPVSMQPPRPASVATGSPTKRPG
jgi:hypothetical protein